jgi:hypothetical protein
MKKYFFIGFFLLLLMSFKAAVSQDTIYWSPCYKLKFEDFKGKTDTTKIDLANSRIGINYTYNVINGKLQFKVTCYFLKSISWSKYNMTALMQHEQCHFDIAKLFALKLEQKFRAYKLTTNVYYDLKSVYNTIAAERLVMDNLYDKIEKENPNTDVTQKKFERNIRKQLVICKKKG